MGSAPELSTFIAGGPGAHGEGFLIGFLKFKKVRLGEALTKKLNIFDLGDFFNLFYTRLEQILYFVNPKGSPVSWLRDHFSLEVESFCMVRIVFSSLPN